MHNVCISIYSRTSLRQPLGCLVIGTIIMANGAFLDVTIVSSGNASRVLCTMQHAVL